MRALYPAISPYEEGMLDVGDGQRVRWGTYGSPGGRPVVVLHGGPGSGCGPGWARFFDPRAYRIVLFDQRGCGRSTPSASDPGTSLAANTTGHLIADIERLRTRLGVERWAVFGGSWGSALGLAYAQAHPERVTETVLFGVTASTRREIRWITRDVGRIFPAAWARFRDGVPPAERGGDLAAAYARLLADPDPAVRERAAWDWCAWEDTHVALHEGPPPPGGFRDPRYADPEFRMGFARLVTHYWSHAGWLEEGVLLREIGRLAGIHGVLAHGRYDVSSPPDVAWELARAWPGGACELTLVDEAGHGRGPRMDEVLVAATDRFAAGS